MFCRFDRKIKMKRIHQVKDKYDWYFDKFYKYLTPESAINALENCTLKFSNPKLFNDPLDCSELFFSETFESFNNKGNNDKLKILKSALLIADCLIKDDKEIANKIKSIRNKMFLYKSNWTKLDSQKANEKLLKVYNLVLSIKLDDLKRQYFICCFSENYKTKKSTLMWSHYGQSHKGLCIGFDYSKIKAENILEINEIQQFTPYRVKYTSNLQTLNPKLESSNYDWLLLKSNIWDYEKEVRVIVNEPKLNEEYIYREFPKELVFKIVFGANAEKGFIKRISEIIIEKGYKNVVLEKMYVDFDLKLKSRIL